jgi:hypothetical protein
VKGTAHLGNLKPWPKGVSGNPGGRPKKTAVTDALRGLLAQVAPGDKEGRTCAEAVAEVLIKQALLGNAQAAREIMDRTEGRSRVASEFPPGEIRVTIRSMGED